MDRTGIARNLIHPLALALCAALALPVYAKKFPQTAEDVLIVDCLLPGQVRKLGRINSFLSQRRPARLSQFECGLRGGEYVEYDRATLQTSLAVWLAAATAGEVEAMTMVGEAFAKGLGAQPDYAQAKQWFDRAAKAGDKRAMQNLGHLYELGLGVAADRETALDWYRRASGVDGERVVFTSTLFDEEAIKSELTLTQAELAAKNQEISKLRSDVASLQSQMDAKKREVQKLKANAAKAPKPEEVTAMWLVLEERIRQQEQQLIAQNQSLATLELAIVAPSSARNTALAQLGSVGFSLIDPPVMRTRGTPTLQSNAGTLKLLGRVAPRSALQTLWIAQTEVEVTDDGLFNAQIATGGLSRLAISALDARGIRSQFELMLLPANNASIASASAAALTGAAAPAARTWPKDLKRGKRILLTIGNRNYQSFEDLGSPVDDADALANLLRTRYGFGVRTLRDATRLDMLLAFDQLRRELKPEDDLVVFFAGHGVLAEKQGYWVPSDGRADSPQGWVSNRIVSDWLASLSARNVLVIADSCYGGTLTQSSVPVAAASFDSSAWQSWAASSGKGRSRLALTSGGVRPVLDAKLGKHSVFATALLAALQRSAQVMEAQQLFREVTDLVAFSGAQVTDLPTFAPIQFAGHERGELLLEAKP
jgi:hypothetical protein